MKSLNVRNYCMEITCLDLRTFVTVLPRPLVPRAGGDEGDQGVVTLTPGNVDADACIFDKLFERFGVNVTVNVEITDFGKDKIQSEKFTFSGNGGPGTGLVSSGYGCEGVVVDEGFGENEGVEEEGGFGTEMIYQVVTAGASEVGGARATFSELSESGDGVEIAVFAVVLMEWGSQLT